MNDKDNNKENEDKEIKVTKKAKKSKKTKEIEKNQDMSVIEFEDLEGKFIHVKVGTSDSPASREQIEEIQNKIISLFEKNNISCLAFVTHHAVSMEIIEKEK